MTEEYNYIVALYVALLGVVAYFAWRMMKLFYRLGRGCPESNPTVYECLHCQDRSDCPGYLTGSAWR